MKDMKQRGMNITQIAEELDRDRKTVGKWLEQDWPRELLEAKANRGKAGWIQGLHPQSNVGGMLECASHFG
ncbi:hypothetical protein C8Z91_34880 [Paenibacillus elgii]|uniref:Uncharacterized protein n=1 Tax=Paenibacillus elgii TaxID=189691 RepID=A0A2T6FRV3_9BACL|nr:hypothetical protein [Paenibacillus elgii]PUA34651.1 hypothetical protein C8Z91_34880 [Paenibacillus elgii]